ncbi:MAG: hypothetical protein AAGB05_14070 [Pseudomonadota bacterium]
MHGRQPRHHPGDHTKVAGDPEFLMRWLGSLGGSLVVIGLEAVQLSQRLRFRLTKVGLDVVPMETRQVKGA